MKEFELTYSAQKTGFDPAKRYANPRYFDGNVRAGVTKVTIVGNWPAVAEAYEAAGIPVSSDDVKKAPKKPVEIPANPENLAWDQARKLANDLGHDVVNKAQAVEAVQGTSEELGTDSGDQFSDEQLREVIETVTGEKVHHRTGREKLVAMYNELNAA